MLGENARKFVENVNRASDGNLNLKLFEPGALVPGLESIPAVSKGSLEMTWAASGFSQEMIVHLVFLPQFPLDQILGIYGMDVLW